MKPCSIVSVVTVLGPPSGLLSMVSVSAATIDAAAELSLNKEAALSRIVDTTRFTSFAPQVHHRTPPQSYS